VDENYGIILMYIETNLNILFFIYEKRNCPLRCFYLNANSLAFSFFFRRTKRNSATKLTIDLLLPVATDLFFFTRDGYE